jgi:hypothetical protein
LCLIVFRHVTPYTVVRYIGPNVWNVLPPSLGHKSQLGMERSRSDTEKEGWVLWYFGAKLHGPTSQKTVTFIVTAPELLQPSCLNRQWCNMRDITNVYLDSFHHHWLHKHNASKARCFPLQVHLKRKAVCPRNVLSVQSVEKVQIHIRDISQPSS